MQTPVGKTAQGSTLKVGLIVPGFSSDATDWCIPVLVDVVRELSRHAEVHVFALRYPLRHDRYRLHGAQIHSMGGGDIRGPRRAFLLAAALASVLGEHRRGPFAVVHGLWTDEPGFVAVTAARLLRIPAIVSVMGGELQAMPDIGYGGNLAPSNRLLSAAALRTATRVTAASTQAIEAAQRALVWNPILGPKVGLRAQGGPSGPRWAGRPGSRSSRLTRLVWGVDPCLFQPDGPSLELAGDLRVLHVGSLVPVKDQATLLRAIARVKGTHPGVHLHVVGDGPLRAQLTAQAQELGLASPPRRVQTPASRAQASVTFHGQVDRRDLAAYYRGADMLAVSSRYEAQLVVALEAALCGTPIVGTAVGLVADFAPGAAMGVGVGDDVALAEAIRAAEQPQIRRELGDSARRLVASEYLAAHTAERLMSMYRNPSAASRPTLGPKVGFQSAAE